MTEDKKDIIETIKSAPKEWCDSWGRKMGIYGNNNHGIPPSYDDDLDAFRHAFANALIVGYNPLGILGFDKLVALLLGMLNELGNPEHKCSYQMDVHNNKIGRGLAPDTEQMIAWYKEGKDLNEEIAKIVARAVKSGKTINDLGDPRMSAACQARYGKKKQEPKKDKSEKEGQYIWRTSGDNNVRTSHAMREGKVFSWDNPPEGGHPGEDYGCRCTAEPYPNENTPYLEKIFGR